MDTVADTVRDPAGLLVSGGQSPGGDDHSGGSGRPVGILRVSRCTGWRTSTLVDSGGGATPPAAIGPAEPFEAAQPENAAQLGRWSAWGCERCAGAMDQASMAS